MDGELVVTNCHVPNPPAAIRWAESQVDLLVT